MNADTFVSTITAYLTAPDFFDTMRNLLLICLGCMIIGALFRLIFGKGGTMVRSVTAVMGILIIYCICFALEQSSIPFTSLLPDLPFIEIDGSSIHFFHLKGSDKALLSAELINLIILVFLFGLLDDLLPKGKKMFVWLLLRCVAIAGTLIGFCLVHLLFAAFLPDAIIKYAPTLLLILLTVLLAVTVFKWLIGLVLGVTGGPILGAVYTFFISHIVGRQLTKAALTSGLLVLLIYLCNHFGIESVTILDPIGMILIPAMILLAAVWYAVSKLF